MDLIILAGMPATGKSTIAAKLRAHFGYPVLEKDRIKEGLFDTIGFKCYAEKRQLDVAANEVLLRMMKTLADAGVSMIADNNFDEESAAKLKVLLEETESRCVTVFLTGDPQVLYERYFERDSKGLRHLGHAMQTHYPLEEGEKFEFGMTREGFDERFVRRRMDVLSWGKEQIRLDATWPETIDVDRLIKQIEEKLR